MDTDESYRELPAKMQLKNAYWLYEALAMIVESHYGAFKKADIDYQKALSEWARTKIATVDAAVKAEANATDFLTQQNHEIAAHYHEATTDLLAQLVTEGTQLSKLTFVMDKNL
jgi:dipeptidase